MGGIFKSILKIAPIAASFIPGVGPLAGAAIGALGGGLSGGGLKGALLGGVTGALGGGGATALGKAAGLAGTGLKAASGALTGASAGLYSGGGLKSALLGGLTGGAIGGLSNGLSSAYDSLGGDAYGAIENGGTLGKVLQGGDSLINAGKAALGFGNVNDAAGAPNVSGAGQGAGASSFGKVAQIGSLVNSGVAQEDMEDQLLESQRQAAGALDPYAEAGKLGNARLSELLGLSGDPNSEGYGSLGEQFNPGDLTQDPGYQFRLDQGQQALDRSLGAKGKVFSGEALQAAQNFGQGLADQTYTDAYNRWRTGQQDIYNRYAGVAGKGQSAAEGLGDIYGNQGLIKANATLGQSNLINSGLSTLLGGGQAQNGADGRRIIGYDANNNPIYEKESIYG